MALAVADCCSHRFRLVLKMPLAPAKKPIGPTKNEMVASLAVINAKGASLQGNKLTLTGVAPNSIVFADRPVRAVG